MTYIDLGPRAKVAAADTSGANPGNYTTTFTSQDLLVNVPIFEVYKMIITGVPAGGNVTVYHNNQVWSFSFPNGGSEWDPSQPKQMRDGDTIEFRWNIAVGGAAPSTTIWLRYDPALTDIYGVA